VVEKPVVAEPVVAAPVELAAPEIVAAPVAVEPAPAPAPVVAETPALPMASTGRAPNDPREVRRRRLEAERLQKEAEAAAVAAPQVEAAAEPAPAVEAVTPPAPASDEHVKPVKEVVTEHGEELEENKEHKPS
jgi:ribonuclease E